MTDTSRDSLVGILKREFPGVIEPIELGGAVKKLSVTYNPRTHMIQIYCVSGDIDAELKEYEEKLARYERDIAEYQKAHQLWQGDMKEYAKYVAHKNLMAAKKRYQEALDQVDSKLEELKSN